MTIEHSRLNIGSFQTTVRPDDPVVRDHRVHGVPVLPGVALLDAVMRAAELSGVDPATTELGNVLFESAVTVPGGSGRRLVFRSSDRDDGVQVVVRAKSAEPGADDEEERQCAECLLRPADESRSPAGLDVAAVRLALDAGAGTPIEDRYSALRALGIEHGDFMRARGTVLAHGDRLVAELVLAEETDRRRDDFFLPPTFLDAAIVATLTDALTEAGHLFLPVYIGSFRAWKRPGSRVYAATRPGGAVRRGDAVETDVWLYDTDGSVVAELLRFTAMRTSADHLARPPAPPPPEPAQATAKVTARPAEPRPSRRPPIAIVGLSGRYPGACDLDELWDNLEAGREAIGPVPAERWDPAEYETATRKLSRFGGFLTDVDKFDPLFFRIPPTGAELLDPQERLFLEAAYGAIENAGYQPFGFAPPNNRIGVFVGASWTDYRLITAEAARDPGTPTAVSGLSAIANRVSYTLNLTGPSMVVDTACSASLTALHVACRSLADGDCDAVIVGGVNLLLHPEKFLIYSQMNLVSSDGRVRSFGAGGDGHVPGEGVGALFLKPLDRAVADGDTVHGVILATAVNHGGQAAGFTVPRPDAQAEVIGRALAEAEIDPDSIGYVEAHGTGTALGDPVEMAGLARAFAGRTKPLAVGSVKSNVGHLESAAGVIGVTRALLQFRHGRITPSLHSEVLNPDLDLEATPFYVPQQVEQWPRPTLDGAEQRRRSAISSFGAGGSNAHVVIEEYFAPPAEPEPEPEPDSGAPELIVLSARSPTLLTDYARRIAAYLRQAGGELRLADVARTLQAGRPALEARLGFPASSPQEASAILERFATGDSTAVCAGNMARQPDPADAEELSRRYQAGDLARAALLWSAGVTPDWTELNGGPQRRIPLPGYPFDRRSFWIGERRGQGAPAATGSSPGLLASARPAFEATLEPVTDRLERAFPALGQYAAAALQRRLRELGILPGVISRAELSQRLGVIPAYERFVDAFLAVLERHGGLRRQDDEIDQIELLGGTANPLTRAEVLAWFGDAEPIIRFADTCLRAYPEILSGRTPATEVLFADASMDLMAGVYRGNRVYDFYSDLGGRFVACAAASASPRGNRPVRVLEVGAGTGAASHPALAALAAGGHPVEYYYTDVGGSFVAHGRAAFGPGYPFARFERFDMEQDPQGQGFEPASVDVILAAGVLHAAADIDATLARLRGLLAPGGVLVACEAVEDHDIMAVAAGLFAGWTSYRDADRRIANSPLLTEAGWAAAFARTGYEGFTSYGPGLTGDPSPGHRMMVAGRPPATAEDLSGIKLGAGPVAVARSTPAAGQSSTAATAQEPPDDNDDQAAELCEPVVAEIVARKLGIESREIRRDRSFAEFGVDSILAVAIVGEINAAFGLSMKPTVLFDYPSVRDLSDLVASEGGRPPAIPAGPPAELLVEPAGLPVEPAGSAAEPARLPSGPAAVPAEPERPPEAPARTPAHASAGETAARPLDIAVIGMAGRYPDADDYRTLWRNLAAGHDSVTEVPPTRWDLDACYQPGPPAPGKICSRSGAYLTDVDRFDPLFFGISPGEADFMDPQQRLFLEESWRAIEDAGMDPRRLKGGRCGVFAGAPPSDYLSLIRAAGLIGAYGSFTGNSPAILPARIAYHLDLVGPCVAVDTACSSSLVAIYQACRSLTDGECDLALAGGVAAFATPEHLVLSSSVGMLSPTGRCRPFDADADGLALGEGVGVVLLKPLARALADGDPVHGVIKGIAVNQDGHTNGITAPSARSQAALALEVYRRFGIDPAAIGYVETHGTGTALGDPIEVEALTSVFRQFTDRRQFIPIGSIKSNIGHTSHAAGVAGLIKVLLAMRAGQLPPSLHFQRPNPLIAFEETPFFVGTDLRPWNGGRRTAAVSSFGFSGTNCHLVVEEHVDARRPTARPAPQTLVPLSSQTGDGLRRQAAELVRFLADRPDPDRPDPDRPDPDRPDLDLHDLAATLATGRTVFEHRLAVIAESASELCDRLSLAADGRTGAGIFLGCAESEDPRHARGVVPGAGLEATAEAWVTGEVTSLDGLHPDGQSRRIIHLPGYAFARDRCWVPGPGSASPEASPQASPGASHQPASPADNNGLGPRAQEYLKRIFAAEARLPAERIKPRTPLEDYGIESILITQLTRRLEADFGDLPSTLFFEYQTLGELAGYFATEHAERLAAVTDPAIPSLPVSLPPQSIQEAVQGPASREPKGSASRRNADVAVIGMSGRFPMADSVEELWRNLAAGRDCITEIPADRWDHGRYLSEDQEEPGTTYARWGGFIGGVDRFDARFFGISPKDAEAMDPQQRLFLETAWAAMEDGGYSPQRARRTARRRGTKDVGVFVGVTYGEYQLLVDIPIAGYWAVANRVSYHLGFNGPSLAVDTACSSSLTAVHLALESLRRGECGYALAGGVNVTIHPGKFLLLGLGGWASTDGRCRTFGAGGDGYVPGEGVAALLLKPLADAIADGDRIYGVIRGSAANQDGRTNGFTVPSPVAQAELVREAMTDAAIDPRSVSYVEAHGTGTSLGDPIEIAALTRAFRGFTADRGFCAVGSAKSSIGHLEAAAGIAGLVKVLLQLRHDLIAPTLHAQPPNPNIDFAKSPFRVALTAEPWRRDPDGTPRIAAVSSFGAGGSNAHVIITDPPPAPARSEGSDQAERLIVLSARRRDQLEEQARSLARFLRSECGRQTRLADVAWTLVVGRESFEHRLALVGLSHADLAARLEEFADNGAAPDGLTGTVGAHETTGGEAPAEVEHLRDLVADGDLRGLGRLWTQGWSVEWEDLAGPGRALAPGQIVSLPTYPFARDRYWIVPADYRRRDQHHASPAPPAAPVPAATPVPAPAPAPASSGDQDELEQRITEIFSDLTKMPADQMDVHADFLDFGFDSIITVRMLNRLMKAYGTQLPGTAIEEYTTIRSLASYLIEDELITAGADGATVRAVDPRITRVITAPARQPEPLVRSEPFGIESIFITGVTGVLGGKLLYDLLSDTTVLVTCLVRGQDAVKALDRVRYFLSVYDVEERLREEFDRRVSVVLGDVSQDQLGLDDDAIAKLAATTDLTIHAAARTTLVTFYDALAPVNVDGTRRAIDFALRTKHKYLVYVSSFSVVGDWQIYDHPPFKESDIELGQGYEHLPYQETKYHSEKLIRAATDEGLVWNIFRPGNIMGEGRTGRYPFAEVTVKGVFYDIFKTVAETGIAMLSPNHWDVSPVDYVSAGLLHLALRRPSYRETYHLTNPDVRSMYELFRLIGDFGYPMRPISIDTFHKYATERLFRKTATGEPYESATIEVLKYGIEIWGREHYEQSTAPDATYTSAILRTAGIECPAIAELMPRYLSHCIEIGYLDPPPRIGGGAGGGESGSTDAVVFPGQGAQKRGMGADYHAKFAIARQTFEEASDAIGEDVARICFDEDERLRRTEFTQPCLLTAEVAAYRVAAQEFGLSARLFGGHSVGEYTALVASGAVTLPDAVRLVRRRGELMQRAVPEGEGGMAALIHENIAATGALAVIRALGAEIANLNSPHQVAISASAGCLEEVRRVLAEAVPDLDYVALKVSAPFHSRLMLPAEHDFEPYLRECAERFRPERAAVVTSNLTGDFHDPAALTGNLLRQISQPVRWQDNMRALTSRADRIFEIGPRGSLTKFFRAIDYSVIPITTLDEALDQLKAIRRMP